MDNWAVIAIISGAITALVTWIMIVWGNALKRLFADIIFNVDDDLHRKSENDYRDIINDTMNALKERISLLEKWRDEAMILEKRVEELESKLRELRGQKEASDLELQAINSELLKTRQELQDKEASMIKLREELDSAYEIMKENVAKLSDDRLKISALLHQIGGEDSTSEEDINS